MRRLGVDGTPHHVTSLNAVREAYLLFVAAHTAPFTPGLTLRTRLATAESVYQGLAERDNGYPQLTTRGIPTSFNGAARRYGLVHGGHAQEFVLTTDARGTGRVEVKLPPGVFSGTAKDAAVTAALVLAAESAPALVARARAVCRVALPMAAAALRTGGVGFSLPDGGVFPQYMYLYLDVSKGVFMRQRVY